MRVRQPAHLRRDLVELVGLVLELAIAEVGPACPAALVVDAHGARGGEALLDAVPARIPQVERVADARIGRAEQQLEEAVVPRPLDDDADAAEAVTEAAHPLLERREPALQPVGCLDRERKPTGT